MENEETSYVPCPDCDSLRPIMFFLADSEGGLRGFARCDYCRAMGASDSLHIKVKASRKVCEQAIIDGLPVCTVP